MVKKIGRIRIGRRTLRVWRQSDRNVRIYFGREVIPLTPAQVEQLKNLLEVADSSA